MSRDNDAGEEAGEAGGGKAKGGKKKLIMIVVGVALVVGIGAKFTILSGGKAKAATPVASPSPGPVIDLGNMTLNLADTPGPHYAMVGLAVELTPKAAADKITAQVPLLKDAALRTLSGLTMATLLTPAGQDGVRATLTDQAQGIFGKDSITKVLLTEVVVQ
jgi:flagellar FliL protein